MFLKMNDDDDDLKKQQLSNSLIQATLMSLNFLINFNFNFRFNGF